MNEYTPSKEDYEKMMKEMQDAFEEFHIALSKIKADQNEVIKEIHARIDAKKINDIHQLLQQAKKQ